MPRFNPVFVNLSTYPIATLEAKKRRLINEGHTVYDFGTGDPIESTPQFIRDALTSAVTPNCRYPTVKGSDSVRHAISGYMKRRFGVVVDPDTQILPTAGSKEVVFHTPLLVIDAHAEDRAVIFPDPGYPAYQRGALFAGGQPHPVLLTDDHIFRPWLLPINVLERARLLWINTPHNPSGAVTPKQDLKRIVELCQEHDILCVSDETYADIYTTTPPHSILECGTQGVLALHSLSKRSGMTGYRSGFIAGDADIISKLVKLRSNPGLVPQSFVNAAAEVAWADDQHVINRRKIFSVKKALFTAFFDEIGLEVIGREASLYLWVRCPAHSTSEAWADDLLNAGIVVSPGTMFGVNGGGKGYVRLAMVPTIEACQQAIAIWRTLV